MFATASYLYDNVLNIYTSQYDKLSKAQKKKIKSLNRAENVAPDLYLDADEDDLPPMLRLEDDEKVKSEPEKASAEWVKLSPRKNTGTWLKILTSRKLLTRLFKFSSTNKNWKQSIENEKLNQTNTLSAVSVQ